MKPTFIYPLFFSVLFISCGMINGLVEKGGKLADGSAFEYKTNSRWRALDGSGVDVRIGSLNKGPDLLMFKSPSLPWFTFYATEPDENGAFFLANIRFLAGNYGGWNEWTVDAEGKGRLISYGSSNAAFTVLGRIGRNSIVDGKIRRENTRLLAERARDALRGRDERIKALTEWMHDYVIERYGEDFVFETTKEFDRFWKPLILPSGYKEKEAAPNLPERLARAYEDGAIESDWNEASVWIYIDYNWDYIMSVLNNEVIMEKIK